MCRKAVSSHNIGRGAVTIVKNLLIKLVFCFCVANFAFAAEEQGLVKREYSWRKSKQLETLRNRLYDEDVRKQVDDNDSWIVERKFLGFRWEEDVRLKARRLIEQRADPDTMSSYNFETPLCLALKKNDLVFARFLLQHSADPNLKTPYGVPLYAASTIEQMELLMEYGARMHGIELLGAMATRKRSPALFEYCCKLGCNPNEIDDDYRNHGYSPLHLLFIGRDENDVEAEVEASAKILISFGGNLASKNRNGDTPVDILRSPFPRHTYPNLIAPIIAFNEALQMKPVADALTFYLNTPNLTKMFCEYAGKSCPG